MKFSDWPWGTRARVDAHGIVEELDDDVALDYWLCCRVDEPWTWRILSNQHVGTCCACGAAIIYRVSAKSPTDPRVPKICVRCAQRKLEDENGA